LEGLEIEDVGNLIGRQFYGHLLYFEAIWNIVRLFYIYFSRFGLLYQEKSGNPGWGLGLAISGQLKTYFY
jgi:hypothetical protein